MNARAVPLLLSLLAATAAYTLGYLGNEDFWWYLASGDAIVAGGAIPDRDPFLYTSPEQATWVTSSLAQRTWVSHSWLWTAILALLNRSFGLWSIAVFSTLCVAALALLLFTRARLDRFGLAAGLITASALAASIDRFTPRAELASCLLLVVTLVLLDRSRPLGWRAVAILAGVQWLWSNLHGGYPLGIFAGFAYGFGGWIQARWAARAAAPRHPAPPPSDAPQLWLGPVLCLASIATPGLGLERVHSAIAFAQQLGTTTAGPIVEWQRTYAPGFGPAALLHVAFLCLGAISIALERRPRSLPRMLVFAGTALLGVAAVRFVSVFAIATAAIALSNFGAIEPALARRFPPLRRRWSRALHAIATAACCAFLLATAGALWTSRDALGGSGSEAARVALRPEFAAPGAAGYIREHALPGPIFNEIALGGYLIYALYPEYQLFIDTRNLSASVLDDYRRAVARPESWRALQERHGFRTVVLSNLAFAPLPLRRLLVADPEWRLVFFDPQAAVFVRTDGEPPPGEFDFTGRWGSGRAPYLPPDGPGPQRQLRSFGMSLLREYLHALAELEQFDAVDRVATEALAQAPGDAALLEYRGYARLRSGRPRQAARDYSEVLQQAPENVGARINLARALNRSGRAPAALRELERAQELDPANEVARALRDRIRAGLRERGEAGAAARGSEVDRPARNRQN